MRQLLTYTYHLSVLLMLVSCAQPGSLGGGTKDTAPAVVLKCDPPNESANFTGNKFTIYFDEFVELDNINQKILISPPTDKIPEFHLKGKSLQVQFKEDLKPNTTYSIYFGDAIVDITEKNPLLNYSYIFSTGDFVDSLSLRGSVINSFDLKPLEGISVMLYKDNNDTLSLDSLPLAVKPYYLSKTDASGNFIFNGLGDDSYLLFALKDMNSNYFYDQPQEEIAFLDSLVRPEFANLKKIQTELSKTDSTAEGTAISSKINQDSMAMANLKITNYKLKLFAEKDSVQKLLQAELPRKNTIMFSFSLPADSVHIQTVNFASDSTWFIEQFSKHRDTITWYLKSLPVDTLEFLIFNNKDTLEKVFLGLTVNKRTVRGAKKKSDIEAEKELTGWTSNIKAGILLIDKIPEITFQQPIISWRTDSALLIVDGDSTYNPEIKFLDEKNMVLQVPMVLKENTKYLINFPDSAFTDWNGLHTGVISLSFRTKAIKDYGTFKIHLSPEIEQNYILRLLGEKDVLVREFTFRSDTIITMPYLEPAKYTLKLIFDNNGNKLWDTGKYIYKIQPEKILFYAKPIDVRANWDIEEEWNF